MTPSLFYGGEEISTINIARELKKRGYEPVLMSSGGPLEKLLERNSIRFVKAPLNGRGIAGIFRGALEVRRFLKNEDVHIIHAQTPWPALMARAALFSRREKTPVIWHNRGIQRKNYKFTARLANIFFDFVITNSNDEKDLLIKAGIDPGKVQCIHNGLNVDDHLERSAGRLCLRKELGIDKGSFLVGMVGRMVEEKGFKWLILAAKELQRRCGLRSPYFVLVGDGALYSDLMELTFKHGLRDRFFFLGFRDNIPLILKELDALVVPSEFEPFGNIVAEGMLAGIPVIASRVGGIKEIISDEHDGLFVEPKDPAAIAEKIEYLMRNSEEKKRIALNGREKIISYFNIQRVVDEIEEVYARLAS
jgi:glycosyltransferase involved in cell wall biosynthesis